MYIWLALILCIFLMQHRAPYIKEVILMKLVNSEQFNEEIKTGLTVAKFFATWCGPCKMQTPIVEQIEEEMKGKADFIEIDIDQSPDVTKAYEIMGVPTIIIFKDGQKVDQIVGFMPKEPLQARITAQL